MIVVMQASNVLTECIGDQEHLTFKVDVKVQNIAVTESELISSGCLQTRTALDRMWRTLWKTSPRFSSEK